ncbi:MAG TPA: hypothetical protein VFV19_06735 [Candidatus Polarisedimenticolaceae bacterium]|nr:hypothetical protein [Candidatus Polarisedimenticolaceae bacterium]
MIDDAKLADAWSSGPKGAGCPDDDRYLAMAQGLLAPHEIERLLDHTASCPACALALRTAAAIHEASGEPLAERRASLWSRLTVTLLRPEAALAYLVLLALMIPAYRFVRPSPAPVAEARIVGLESEPVTRGGEPPAPLALSAGGPLVLRLFVDRDDVRPEVPLELTLGNSHTTIPAATLDADGALAVTLDPKSFPRGEALRLEVRSGTSVVFARSIVLEGDSSPGR